MTATPARDRLRRLEPGGVAEVIALLESDFGRSPPGSTLGTLVHQYLLDALDRGERDRFFVWPAGRPEGLLFAGPTGTLVPAGHPEAGEPLAEAGERLGWRVLVGDAAIGGALIEASSRSLFRRRINAREQRFMAVEAGAPALGAAPQDPAGLRPARRSDLEVLVDFACRLHVEDRMGPPIPRSARSSVRARMVDSIARGATYVVERNGRPVAKADLSLRSAQRGGQIAGVYVDASVRGRGIASSLVAAVIRLLLAEGLPSVSLHVRSDNGPAIAAYSRAGLSDRAAWVLALR